MSYWRDDPVGAMVGVIVVAIFVLAMVFCAFMMVKGIIDYNAGHKVGEKIAWQENAFQQYWIEYHASERDYRKGIKNGFWSVFHDKLVMSEKP